MATIRERGDKWEVMIRRKGHKPIYQSFTKKVLAEKWAREKENEMDEGSYRDLRAASRAFLNDLCGKYLAVVTPTKKTSSYIPEKARLGTLNGYFKGVTLAQVSIDHVLNYVKDRLSGKGFDRSVGSDAVRKELQLLSDVIDSAMTLWGLHIVANPVQNAKRIMRKLRMLEPGNKRERRLLPGEYEKISNASHKNFTLINKIALFDIETCLRRSELANLKREHIDIGRRVLHVTESKTDWNTGTNGRVIPLSQVAIDIYKSLPARIDGSVFGVTAHSISQAFQRLCEDQGIVGLRFHDLRHEGISRLFEKGLTVEEVASISGHEDWKSLKRYTHPDPEKIALKL